DAGRSFRRGNGGPPSAHGEDAGHPRSSPPGPPPAANRPAPAMAEPPRPRPQDQGGRPPAEAAALHQRHRLRPADDGLTVAVITGRRRRVAKLVRAAAGWSPPAFRDRIPSLPFSIPSISPRRVEWMENGGAGFIPP